MYARVWGLGVYAVGAGCHEDGNVECPRLDGFARHVMAVVHVLCSTVAK